MGPLQGFDGGYLGPFEKFHRGYIGPKGIRYGM